MSTKNIILDYGAGNTGSIISAFRRIGVDFKVSCDESEIIEANRLILPGVGNFGYAMKGLQETDLIELLKFKISVEKVPTLGICAGMQILASKSHESASQGLGLLDIEIKRIPMSMGFKLPHIGWNQLSIVKSDTMNRGISDGDYVYFSNSYGVLSSECKSTILEVNHGVDIVAALRVENLIGVQFHPEKSGEIGVRVLENFCELAC